jgi:hypothetical protein
MPIEDNRWEDKEISGSVSIKIAILIHNNYSTIEFFLCLWIKFIHHSGDWLVRWDEIHGKLKYNLLDKSSLDELSPYPLAPRD